MQKSWLLKSSCHGNIPSCHVSFGKATKFGGSLPLPPPPPLLLSRLDKINESMTYNVQLTSKQALRFLERYNGSNISIIFTNDVRGKKSLCQCHVGKTNKTLLASTCNLRAHLAIFWWYGINVMVYFLKPGD